MNETLKHWVETEKPKIETLDQNERNLYRFGLMILASFVSDDFIDLPLLPSHKYETDGLYYTIPYFHDDTLWSSSNSRTLLVVWQIENRSSFCPLRIEVQLGEENNYKIVVCDQRGERTVKNTLIEKEGTLFYTEIKNHNKVTLSQLVD